MIVWFEQGTSEDNEYTEYTYKRSTNHNYEYYDIMFYPSFPNKWIREIIHYSYLSLYTIYYFILCMKQEPTPPVVSPLTLKYSIGKWTDSITE